MVHLGLARSTASVAIPPPTLQCNDQSLECERIQSRKNVKVILHTSYGTRRARVCFLRQRTPGGIAGPPRGFLPTRLTLGKKKISLAQMTLSSIVLHCCVWHPITVYREGDRLCERREAETLAEHNRVGRNCTSKFDTTSRKGGLVAYLSGNPLRVRTGTALTLRQYRRACTPPCLYCMLATFARLTNTIS